MEKDKLYNVRNTIEGQDKAGRDKIAIYIDQAEVQALIEDLQSKVGNERGVKITIHTGDKTLDNGRSFRSSFFFVAAVQEAGAGGAGGARRGGTFRPKQQGMSDATRSRAASVLNKTVE